MEKIHSVKFLLLLFLCLTGGSVLAAIKLPGLVGDNMILQRDLELSIWGWADAKELVMVEFKSKTYQAHAAADGKWQVKLSASPAGGPFNMVIKTNTDQVNIKNILIGDVWLCGGQSNMAFDLNFPSFKANYAAEIAASANNNIRQVIVNRTYASQPASNFKTSGWRIAAPETVGSFSATAYFFARNLYEKYHIPIGLVNDCIGGTFIEAWTSKNGLKQLSQFDKNIALLNDTVALANKIKESRKAVSEWETAVTKDDKGYDVAGKPSWAAVDLDDHEWAVMAEPDFWDNHGHKNEFGSIWLRKEINIPSNLANKVATLNLGQVDDADVTYFNGVEVGKNTFRDTKRSYAIAASLIKPGKNVIAVRIVNYNGTGGVFPESVMQLKIGSEVLPLNGSWKFKTGAKMVVKPGVYDPKNLPSSLYNAMIAPLPPLDIKGVIWYQGEYNTHRAFEYRTLFKNLINDWRTTLGRENLPFIYVQLPNFQPVIDHPAENEWAELREAQLMALSLPNTAMAVTIDVGGLELHPADKKDVGDRLALAARKLVYGEKTLTASGPLYKSMKIDGNKIILSFETGNGKLIAKGGGELKYFAIAGNDKKFVWAKAVIKGNTVEVSSPQVSQPAAVRYAWAGNPEGCNLYNDAGLPASPFRTDSWPGLTIANQYQ